ncbi:HipA N-terminal domain-containing protein [Ornithinimicrobium faecis]|uniref:HipA N-terminal domain-containing protein n=1 Tax=Ornithinimicrobium faecis TaxID=2934158 RepID=UPI002119087A|nr:HipA N-terminal domain-containing protein [Ornithinimicrobium sp. HY1745]
MTDVLRVFLDGVPAGTLSRVKGGRVTFDYDDRYRRSMNPTPLSLSMPLIRPSYPPRGG